MKVIPPGYQRLSSRWTPFWKWVWPLCLVALLSWYAYQKALGVFIHHDASLSSLLLDVGFLSAFIFLCALWSFTDADAVYKQGDHLLVSNFGYIDRLELVDIKSVEYSLGYKNASHIALRLKRPIRWGLKIRFIPVDSIFSEEETADVYTALKERVRELNPAA